jgi:hypothetical protein
MTLPKGCTGYGWGVRCRVDVNGAQHAGARTAVAKAAVWGLCGFHDIRSGLTARTSP